MKIALLSYGSLITKGSKLVKTKWNNKNAPELPIELCRVTKAGKLVLAVSEENGVANKAYVAVAKGTDLNKVIPAVMKIEGIGESQVCVVDIKNKVASERANKTPNLSQSIAIWARKNGVDAVIWNGLGKAFKDRINVPFSVQAAVSYVNGLGAKEKKVQLAYLKSIPAAIKTPVISVLQGEK